MVKNYTLKDFRSAVSELWPEHTAEPWDNVGLTAGRDSQQISKVVLALDVVRATVDEAIELGADLLFTHHPLLLRGIQTMAEDTYKGSLIADLIRANCGLLSAHTNADVPVAGVSDVLAAKLGLQGTLAIEETTDPTVGIGRVGDLAEQLSLEEVAQKLIGFLPETAVGARVAGERDRKISRVAILGGSGDSLLAHPKVITADVYITSDLRHHPAQEALEQSLLTGGPALIDVPHWASESFWMPFAAEQLAAKMPGVEFVVSTKNTDPWTFRVG